MKVEDILTPALIVVKSRVENNCKKMYESAARNQIQLRPHLKTSKCIEAALMQTAGTKRCMAVSTLIGAEKLFENGFDDVLYAVPLPLHRLDGCKKFAENFDFSVLVDNIEVAEALQNTVLKDNQKWSVFMKLNCENGRAGVDHDSEVAITLAKSLHGMSNIKFKGVYAHCGDTYDAKNVFEVQKVADKTSQLTLKFVEKLQSIDVDVECYGIGSTPSCSHPTEDMMKLTEWHPGNYVFYDKMQERIGSCQESDIACYVISRVIGHYPSGDYMIIDCGWTALHGGGNCCGKSPASGYGTIFSHPELKITGMSQEHGIVKSSKDLKIDFSKYRLGTLLKIYPDHSCATCSMHSSYYVVNDDDDVIDKWFPYRGW